MGFSVKMVTRAIEETGDQNTEQILEVLLRYSATIDNFPSKCGPVSYDLQSSESENDFLDDLSDPEACLDNEEDAVLREKETKLLHLIDMNFLEDEASSAINACGPDTSIADLIDFIYASQIGKTDDFPLCKPLHQIPNDDEMRPDQRCGFPPTDQKRKKLFAEKFKRKLEMGRSDSKESKKNLKESIEEHDRIRIPRHMIGFGIPNEPRPTFQRKLPEEAIGPPYFYFENVAYTPTGVWDTISRFLYEIEPEFVDSLHFCAAARKRGYVHNLPVQNRYLLQPIPPLTIYEALPMTRKWWPTWDQREKFNCMRTCIGSAKLTQRIKEALECWGGNPPIKTQKRVMYECKKWNLLWSGKNIAAPLEPDEYEFIMGYPKDHTRGFSTTERYKAVGNAFQVDTVAYHFSVLKSMFPTGITVLSLFSGIGGAEIALHRLGIPLKTVVSVEISEVSRSIFRGWWEQTNQRGNLIELEDVQELSTDQLQKYINTYGGFDLIVGGSPCTNLTGSNLHHRDGLAGKESILFYDFWRVLNTVKCIMRNNK
ncbi:hypothetical protein AQUCO_05000033v1 [Aquilegia coerulea]|uniref:DNA (cytosine-5-)-methyltransferase n=1 Tax=Aquilegia coerulea TaxID=218851 RepID=A0A2G5CJ77_AQUCA|nr:hypothetical protein AQUCO_05000033v1 [Aquilegia coerulea]